MSDEAPGTDQTAGDRHTASPPPPPPPPGLTLPTLAPVLWAFLPNPGLVVAQAFIMKNKEKKRDKRGKRGRELAVEQREARGLGRGGRLHRGVDTQRQKAGGNEL